MGDRPILDYSDSQTHYTVIGLLIATLLPQTLLVLFYINAGLQTELPLMMPTLMSRFMMKYDLAPNYLRQRYPYFPRGAPNPKLNSRPWAKTTNCSFKIKDGARKFL